MRRRPLLAALAASSGALAGCPAGVDDGTPPGGPSPSATPAGQVPPTSGPSPSATASDVTDLPLRVTVEAETTVDNGYALQPSVEVLEPRVTESHTATVEVAVENTADRSVWEVEGGGNRGLRPLVSEDRRLLLLHPSYAPILEGCWKRDDSIRNLLNRAGKGGFNVFHTQEDFEWAPGQRHAYRLAVFGSREVEHRCLVPGEYRFTDDIGWAPYRRTARRPAEAHERYEWGFTLRVEEA
ncbi:MAG: hypothetical protein ABEJ42_05585 [Halobacteriaceae archaeon]